MESHHYRFSRRDWLGALMPPLAGFALLALMLHGFALARVLPEPLPLRDMDHAVLWNQVLASRQPARLVLVGDSSCLTGVSARQLGDALQMPVRNLGTVSTLGLDAFATLAGNAVSAGAPNSTEVVLLVHPEFLRRPAADPGMVVIFESLRTGVAGSSAHEGTWTSLSRFVGLDLFRDRIESRLRSQPLPGVFGKRYGFVRELSLSMAAEGGGVVDPGKFMPTSSAALPPLTVSPRLEASAESFGSRLASAARLRVGIMPVPASLADPGHAGRNAVALQTLCRWLGPRAEPLAGLPDILPDASFASGTHLNAAGREVFTGSLADALRSPRQ